MPLWQATTESHLCRRHSNTQRQICLSLCGVSWCAKVLSEPSERLWWAWGLILNVILPLQPSCWGFSFALENGLSFFGGIRYDLKQIPFGYTVVVTNIFKGLGPTECLKNHGQRFVTLYRRQWSRPSLRKRTAKRLSEEALQIGEKREGKDKGEKERYNQLNAESQRDKTFQRDKTEP